MIVEVAKQHKQSYNDDEDQKDVQLVYAMLELR